MSEEDVFAGVHEVTIDLPNAHGEDPGLVLKWRRRGDVLEGLVARETEGRLITEWLPALVLSPVVPNNAANEAEAAAESKRNREDAP
jgi:hypothetical protein